MSLKPWGDAKRARCRRPDGCYEAAKLAPHLPRLREAGLTAKQMVEFTGIPLNAIRNALRSARDIPRDRVILAQLVPETGVLIQTLKLMVKREEIATQRWGQKLTVSVEDAQYITEYYARTTLKDPDPEQWWNMARLSAFFGCSVNAMQQRMSDRVFSKIRRYRLAGHNGMTYRYSAEDARRIKSALPVALSKPPRDTLKSVDMAQLLGVRRAALSNFARKGCPHVWVRGGHRGVLYFRVPEVIAWMDQQMRWPYQLHAERLRKSLSEENQHAA